MAKPRNSQSRSYSTRPVLTVNLSALIDNYKYLSSLSGGAFVGAALKADAYGLGVEAVGRALYGAGCRNFFVAHAGEGKFLRATIGNKASIYVLSGPSPQDMALFFGHSLKPVLNSLSQARNWAEAIKEVNQPPRAALHLDTGMNRLGVPEPELAVFAKEKRFFASLHIDLLMSHLASSPNPDNPQNQAQLKAFRKFAAHLPPIPMSLANTGGIFLGKKYHFKMVRPGIGLYGGRASRLKAADKIRPVAELHAPILQIKTIKAGEVLGYDGTYQAKKDMKIAIASAGYADGLPTTLSGLNNAIKCYARFGGQKVPVVGRISMDYTILDVTDYQGFIEPGQKAKFLGEDLDEQAKAAGLISYELLTGIGQRCRRIYIKD